MSTNIVFNEMKYQEFISVDHGTEKISLSIFFAENKMVPVKVLLNLEHAYGLAVDILDRVQLLQKEEG